MTDRTRTWTIAGLGTAAVAGLYAGAVRPWHRRWGATAFEAEGALPGDELAPDEPVVSTRAITIAAPPEAVWPWLAQIGQDRGGFYSYDRLENLFGLRIHSADRIVPEWQGVEVGDFVASAPRHWRLGPEKVRPGWRVTAVEPDRLLVLDGWGAFVLRPLPGGRTRLIVRTRASAGDSVLGRLAGLLLMEPVHFVMERAMLRGIRARAEAAASLS